MYGRVGEGEERYLSKNLFKRELRNGECVQRIILILYSPSQGCLYCFACRLLSKKQSAFATSGFNYWKYSRSRPTGIKCSHVWSLSFAFLPPEVCHFVERIKLLVSENGNFFGILELLSEFDPFGGIGLYCVTILYKCYISIFVFFKICAIFFKLGLPVLNRYFTV